MARNPAGRTPIAVGLFISVAAHVAALVIVKLDVPEPSTTAQLTWVQTVPAEPAPDPEPPIQIIEIRPPGMSLPSGGSAGSSEAAPESTDGGALAVTNVVQSGPRRLDAPGRSSVELAPRAPAVDVTPVVLASLPSGGEAEDRDERKGQRPGRGVVLRQDGASGGSGSSGMGRTGRGIGLGTGGVTVIGPGGDCITPGSSTPVGLSIPNSPTPFTGNGGRATRGRTGGGYSGIRRPR